MDRRVWLARGLASLACGGLSLLSSRTSSGFDAARSAEEPADAPGKSDADGSSRLLPPRLSTDERRAIADALSAAEAACQAASTAMVRGTITADAFATAQDQALTIRLHVSELKLDSAGRMDALRRHAEACRTLVDVVERPGQTSGAASRAVDSASARARLAEAECRILAEGTDAPRAAKARARTVELAVDLVGIRLQDARRGATSLEALAEAIHLATRILSPDDPIQASESSGGGTRSADRSTQPTAAAGRPSAAKSDSENETPEARLRALLVDIRRWTAGRSNPSHAARHTLGATLVDIELSRAASLIPEPARNTTEASPDPRDDAERLADALFRTLVDEESPPLDDVAAAAGVCLRRDEFHRARRRAGRAVSQIHRNELSVSRRRLAEWSRRTVASAETRDAEDRRKDGSTSSASTSTARLSVATVTSRRRADDPRASALRSLVLAQVAALDAHARLDRIDRRLAEEAAGRGRGDAPRPASAPYDDLVRPKVLKPAGDASSD